MSTMSLNIYLLGRNAALTRKGHAQSVAARTRDRRARKPGPHRTEIESAMDESSRLASSWT